MQEIYFTDRNGIDSTKAEECLKLLLEQYPNLKKVLIIPPDYTRCYSYAGEITQFLYRKLSPHAVVHVMPALGTHMAMNDRENQKMFGGVSQMRLFWYTTGRPTPSLSARFRGNLLKRFQKDYIPQTLRSR